MPTGRRRRGHPRVPSPVTGCWEVTSPSPGLTAGNSPRPLPAGLSARPGKDIPALLSPGSRNDGIRVDVNFGSVGWASQRHGCASELSKAGGRFVCRTAEPGVHTGEKAGGKAGFLTWLQRN